MTPCAREPRVLRSRVTRAAARAALRVSLIAGVAMGMAATGACTRRDAGPVRVMTYNIAAGHGDLDRIANVIRTADPDIVGLQEVDVNWSARSGFADQAAELGAALDMHVRFGAIYSLPAEERGEVRSPAGAETLSSADAGSARTRQFGLAILSREPIIEFTNHKMPRLSTQTDVVGPEPMPGFPEAVIDVDGVRLHVFNTHLDYRADPRVREQQVARMLEVMRERAAPQILMGDLNARPDAAELRPLLTRFTDAWSVATGDGATYPAQTPDRRIDYILLSDDVRVAAADVLPALASDHRAVVADILILRPGVRN